MKQYQIDRIRELMDLKGVTNQELASKCGISPMTIGRLLAKPEYNPTTDTLEKIAEALDVTIAQLMQEGIPDEIEMGISGYIEYNGEIYKIKSLMTLQKLVARIEYETKYLPIEAKAIISTNLSIQ